MINELINYFRNKKILILGFGKEGISTYKLIRKYLPTQQLYIGDKKENFQETFDFAGDTNLIFISGNGYLDNLDDYDIIMKSPGISFANLDTSKFAHKIKSQLELLLEFFNNTTIGITGTKGKSTTSSLIYEILKDQNQKSILLGNIGVPVFDYIDKIDEDVRIVLEMSSHQLEYMKMSPNIAILLNIYPEHLDHYKTYAHYATAKCNIYRFQKDGDVCFYNADDEMIQRLKTGVTTADTYKISLKGKDDADICLKENTIYFRGKPIYYKNEHRKLPGDYNLNNIMFALGVSEIFGLDLMQTKKTISNFEPLKHRLEYIGNHNGIKYYDNSIGTIPQATIEAVKALGDVDTLIIGGMDRGIDYTEFIQFLNESKISHIICMPSTGHKIGEKLRPEVRHFVGNLEEAVTLAKSITEAGKSCLLSPTAASYGFFRNFEERGDIFKELVEQMDEYSADFRLNLHT